MYIHFTIMTTTRRAAKIWEGEKDSLQDLTDKGITPDLLQKIFEKFGKKMIATVVNSLGCS